MKVDLNPEPRILRQFGFVALFGFGLIGALAYWVWELPAGVAWGFVGLGAVLALCATLATEWVLGFVLRPVYVLLMLIAIPIGMVISTVLMLLIWFLMFTPLALWFRLIGRDALHRRLDPEGGSYWHERTASRSPASYLKMY